MLLCRSGSIGPEEKSITGQLLVVCQQLYLEGRDSLYQNNTFEFVICNKHSDRHNLRFLGCALSTTDIEARHAQYPIFYLVRNFRIVSKSSGTGRTLDVDDSSADRLAVHWICEVLRNGIEPNKTSISIAVEYDQEFDEDNDIRDAVLEPFNFLRGLANVRVDGVESVFARNLETTMRSHTRADRLWQMKNAFWDSLELIYQENDPVEEIGAEALEAINRCDIETFKVERAKTILEIRAVSELNPEDFEKIVEQMFQYD